MGFCFVSNHEIDPKVRVRNHLKELQSAKKGRLRGSKQNSLALRQTSVTASGSLDWGRTSQVVSTSQGSQDGEQHSGESQMAPRLQTQVRWQATPIEDRALSPMSIISQARTDPFTTYPIPWDSEVDVLYDLANQSMGSSIFGYTTNDSFDIYRSICSIAMTDTAAFHSLMILVTSQRDRLAGRTIPSARALHHRLEAIRLVNERFATVSDTSCLTEGDIFAVMALTGIQGAYNAVGASPHTPGLQQLIIRNGGMKGLHNSHPVLEFVTYGLALMAPMLQPGHPVLYDASLQDYSPLHESLALVKELLEFLTQMNLSFQVRDGQDHPFITALSFAFDKHTTAYRLLTTPSALPGIPLEKQLYVQNRFNRSITTYVFCVLLSLNLLSRSASFQVFESHLRSVLRREWIWRNSSRMLQWFIIRSAKQGVDVLERPAAAWKSFRLVHAIALLEEETQMKVQRYLVDTLTGTGRGDGYRAVDDDCIDMGEEQIERIRLEVVEAVKRQHPHGRAHNHDRLGQGDVGSPRR